jgi:2-amino-4-hydroxy-6-hydroxymethyldihydropteridine diphosphokinase
MPTAFVGLGANLGDATAQVRAAIDALGRMPHTRLERASTLYRTAAIGYADQPDFVNAVVALDTALDAHALLGELQSIEHRAGRIRSFPNAPRTLDLDLLLYDAQRIETPSLVVPHPRMHERAFVLVPLSEIAPDLAIPGKGPAAKWLAQTVHQRIERIAS